MNTNFSFFFIFFKAEKVAAGIISSCMDSHPCANFSHTHVQTFPTPICMHVSINVSGSHCSSFHNLPLVSCRIWYPRYVVNPTSIEQFPIGIVPLLLLLLLQPVKSQKCLVKNVPHTTLSTHFWTAVCGEKYKGVSSFYKKFSIKTIIKKRKTVCLLSLIAHHTHYPIILLLLLLLLLQTVSKKCEVKNAPTWPLYTLLTRSLWGTCQGSIKFPQ
jgi:hypothetical protein